VTPFHHQPEAQHPKIFQLSTSRRPITPSFGGKRTSLYRERVAQVRSLFRDKLAELLAAQATIFAKYWSEWQDLNLRPPRPERGVAMHRHLMLLIPGADRNHLPCFPRASPRQRRRAQLNCRSNKFNLFRCLAGTAGWIRTTDLLIHSQAL
jgi:hypothetical protein